MHSKMTLTYVFHSCFVLEAEMSILLFDYWLDLKGVVPPFLKKDDPVYVFSSHFHEDHFNRANEGIHNMMGQPVVSGTKATGWGALPRNKGLLIIGGKKYICK